MDDMVVSVVADLYVLEAELGEDLLPGLAVDEGGGVHRPAVSDNQNILEHQLCFSHYRYGFLNRVKKPKQSPNFLFFKEPKNRFQGTNSARLCSLAGRYDNPIPTRFLSPIDCLIV